MRQIWFLGAIGAFGGLLCYVYSARTQADEADPLDRVLTMSPNAAAIHSQVAAVPTLSQTKRQELFAELFTERFRLHDPKMAVRARFVKAENGRSHIKLMCPARMEPWNMDRIALVAWREAKDCLGETCDIDIYETFIGALPRKIGELRSSNGKTPAASILYAPETSRHSLTMDASMLPGATFNVHPTPQSAMPAIAPMKMGHAEMGH